MTEGNWQIDYQCPQCGAPVTLDETDRILACPYCRTKLYLVREDGFRYVIPHHQGQDREIYHLPYWRVKGSQFFFRDMQAQFRFVDINRKAVGLTQIPQSLGVRPQAMKLRFLTPEMPGILLAPERSAMESIFPPGDHDVDGGADFIGEVTSLIYTPVYLEGKILYDAVTNRRLNDLAEPGVLRDLPRTDPTSDGKIFFLPTLCPRCGWNLEGEKDALSLHCNNCHSLWQYRKNRLEELDFTILASPAVPDSYLPFWKMKVAADGFALESYADLIRLANLPKVTTPLRETIPLYFWSPAFRINPGLYLRWIRQMTVSQPTVERHANPESISTQMLHPVTLPLTEAMEGVRTNIGQLLSDKRRLLQTLAGTKINLLESELVYHPFIRKNSELIHAGMGLTVDGNALSLAFHLS